MNAVDAEEILINKGVRPTANRILVVRELVKTRRPLSLADLEELMGYTMDKSSIFRVLELFAERDVVHVIEDGSRSQKYELCHGSAHHSISDQHVHFYCECCGKTYCLEETKVPQVEMPEGFEAHNINYTIKGKCAQCAKR